MKKRLSTIVAGGMVAAGITAKMLLGGAATYTQVSIAGYHQNEICVSNADGSTHEFPLTSAQYASLATSPIPSVSGYDCQKAYQAPDYSTPNALLDVGDYVDFGTMWQVNNNGQIEDLDKANGDVTTQITAQNSAAALQSTTSTIQ